MSKVSVIFPTRKRFDLVKKSILSLIDTAYEFSDVEILMATDLDDYETTSKISEYFKNYENIKIVSLKRQYYRGFHVYVNNLCKLSNSQWLFLWNDDCLMKTDSWDQIISSYSGKFVAINPSTTMTKCGGFPFPVIPKKWFEITGHFSLNSCCDTWIQDVCTLVKANFSSIEEKEEEILIFHDRFDQTGNNNDEVFQEKTYENQYYSKENDYLRRMDAIKIINYLKEKNK